MTFSAPHRPLASLAHSQPGRVKQTAALFEAVAAKVPSSSPLPLPSPSLSLLPSPSSSPSLSPSLAVRLPDELKQPLARNRLLPSSSASAPPDTALTAPTISVDSPRPQSFPSAQPSSLFDKPGSGFVPRTKHPADPRLPHTTIPTHLFATHSNNPNSLSMASTPPHAPTPTITNEDVRSDSDSTTTSNMRNSSVGNDIPPPPPEQRAPSHSEKQQQQQQASDDLFLEQEPLGSFELSQTSPTSSKTPTVLSSKSVTVTQVGQIGNAVGMDSIGVLGASARMTEVGMMVQEVALALFEVQELRHSNAFNSDSIKVQRAEANRSVTQDTSPLTCKSLRPSHYSTEATGNSNKSTSTSALTPVDKALLKLEQKVESTSSEISNLSTLLDPFDLLNSMKTPERQFLGQKYDGLMKDWKRILKDTETLKEELKEDKWLIVFRTVSGQAEEMMESLEKALGGAREFIFDLDNKRRRNFLRSSIAEKSRLANKDSDDSGDHWKGEASEVSLSSRLGDPTEVQELLERYLVLCKNFSAKKKHYLPSCEKVLTTLLKGIENRSTKNGEVLRRYADMRTRFNEIQQRILKTDSELSQAEETLRQAIEQDVGDDIQEGEGTLLSTTTSSPKPHRQVPPATTPKSNASSNRTSRALHAVSQYLLTPSSSSLFISQHSSSIKKLATKFSPASRHRAISPISSCQSMNALQLNMQVPTTTAQVSKTFRKTRSILHLPTLAPPTRRQATAPTRHRNMSASPGDQACNDSKITPENLRRSHSGIQNSHRVTKSVTEKPRWNISLKRMEDKPEQLHQVRRTPVSTQPSQSRCPSRYSQYHYSTTATRLGSRGSVPPIEQSYFNYARPGSVVGGSECSFAAHRARPPSRNSRIPAPSATPKHPQKNITNNLTIPSSRALTPAFNSRLPRPPSRCNTPGGAPAGGPGKGLNGSTKSAFSPTPSDLAKLPPTSNSQHQLYYEARPGTGSGNKRTSYQGGEYDYNPFDPLDSLVYKMVKKMILPLTLVRIDPPLSRNAEKVKSSGGGIGDQARYKFFPVQQEAGAIDSSCKAVMCKLVGPIHSHVNNSSNGKMNGYNGPGSVGAGGSSAGKGGERVLVRVGGGWKELEMFLLDLCARLSAMSS